MNKFQVFTVIVTYNGEAWIERCLQNIQASDYPSQIIVVDNASTDGTYSLIKQFTDVNCVLLEENLGFGVANNIGIREALQAGADFIFLLNQDAHVHSDAIGKLVRCAQENIEFGILSPMQLSGDGSQIDYKFSRHIARGTDSSYTKLLSDLYLRHGCDDVYPVSFVNAAAWLMPRSCLEHVGGFGQIFYMYGEDDDLCNRVRFHGFEIGLVPSARVYHARGGRTNQEEIQLARSSVGVDRKVCEMIVCLTELSGRFAGKLLIWLRKGLLDSLNLLLSGNLKELASYTLAFVKTCVQLPQIYRHRQTCRIPGSHWI